MILPNLHRIAKVTLSFVLAFMLFIRLFIVDVSALSAAPIFGEALVEVFSTLLVGSGLYTSEEVSDMSWAEAEDAIDSGISSGAINPLEIVGDVTINGATIQANFLEWLHLISRTSTNVITSDYFGTITDASLQMTLQNYVPVTIGNWFTTVDNDDVIDTPAADMKGGSCAVRYVTKNTLGNNMFVWYYANCTGVIDVANNRYYLTDIFWQTRGMVRTQKIDYDDEFTQKEMYVMADIYETVEIYGDWVYLDGTASETDDTYTDYVGEDYDGDLISLEDIQAGAVPLDDVLLDYDNFTDDTIVDLLNQILAELEQVPVVEEDTTETVDSAKDTVSDMAAELDIADLNNLQMPLGIADVFPFCLPFDFVRGMELLVAKPEVPVFKTTVDFGEINGWDLGEYPVVISFEKWEPVAIVTRWTSLLLFSYVLIFISTKIVKGAGA